VDDVGFYLATERYFETVGLSLVAGRAFTATEALSNADVVIVNETLADRLWPRGDAIDRPLYLVADAKTVRVIGIARNSKYRTLSESARAHLYRPTTPTLGLTLLARTAAEPYQALGAMQRTLDGLGHGLVGFFPRTLDDHLAIDVLPTRAAARAATGLGTLALGLSAVGLYGLVASFVELRRREIGVRMALGATAANVRWLVVRQALGMAIPGIGAGVVLASALAVVARSALFGVQPLDPVALGAGVTALAIVVISASYLPSRRATQVDPATALRQ
jgi:putative ABC transport system permease protein